MLCCAVLCLQHIAPINRLPDPDQQVKARQELVAGPLKDKLALLSKLVVSQSQLAEAP